MSTADKLHTVILEMLSAHSPESSDSLVNGDPLPWYEDRVLLSYVKSLYPDSNGSLLFRFPVQSVNPAVEGAPGLTGTLTGGEISAGDEIMVAASLKRSRIRHIAGPDSDLETGSTGSAKMGDTVTLVLEDGIAVSQGDILHRPGEPLQRSNQFQAHLIWMHEDPMLPERSYLLKIGTQTTTVQITGLKYAINISGDKHQAATKLELNEIAVCNFATADAIAFDTYAENIRTGSFILIDRISRQVVAAGMIDFGLHRGQNLSWQSFEIDRALRSGMKNQKPVIVWFTGLSASGKSTIADVVEQKLAAQNRHTYLLDGDNFRHGLNKDLGFTDADRVENIRRVAEVARLMADSGLIVMTAFISPFRRERRMAREIAGDIDFVEVFVDTPLEICEARDPKGMYAKARRGEIPNFTGISSAYESPEQADIHLDAGNRSAEELADEVLQKLSKVLPGSILA